MLIIYYLIITETFFHAQNIRNCHSSGVLKVSTFLQAPLRIGIALVRIIKFKTTHFYILHRINLFLFALFMQYDFGK